MVGLTLSVEICGPEMVSITAQSTSPSWEADAWEPCARTVVRHAAMARSWLIRSIMTGILDLCLDAALSSGAGVGCPQLDVFLLAWSNEPLEREMQVPGAAAGASI